MWYFIAVTSFQFLWQLLEPLLALGGIEGEEVLALSWICKTGRLSWHFFNKKHKESIYCIVGILMGY